MVSTHSSNSVAKRARAESAGLSAAHLAGAGERLDSRGSRPDGCLRCLYSGLRHREAGTPAERRLLCVRRGWGWTGYARVCHGSLDV